MSARGKRRGFGPPGFALLLVATLMVAPAAQAAKPPKATRAAAASQPGATVGDLGQRNIEVHRDAAVTASASKAMENYQRFLELQNSDPHLRAEALRRLADLNLESGELERMASEVTLLDKQGAAAIQLYSTLLKAYPDYPRNDQVLYQLARAYETTAQPEQALATLSEVVRRYPKSRDLGEVQFRRGELLFSAKRYPEAQAAYQAVIDLGPAGSGFYQQSLYKHGWSLFKQSQNEESLNSFFGVLDHTLGRKGRSLETLSRADRELVDDTLRVMCIAFSYLDGAASADQAFDKRRDVPYAWLVYSRLGDLYVDKQRYQDAAAAYRAFVQRHPVDEHAPTLSMQAIQAYQKGGFAQLVVEGKTEYASTYGFKSAFWNGRQHDRYPQVVKLLKTNIKELAQYYHANAQKSKKLEDYTQAAHWYREYLGSFPEDPEAVDLNYLLADSLFESKQYAQAVGEYEHVAYGYPKGPKSASAAYAGLISAQKQEELLPAADKPAWHAKAVDAGLKFASTFPEHEESAGVLVRAAQDLYAAGDLTRTLQASQQLLARVPPVDRAKQRIAWTLIGQAQFNQNVFDQAETAFVNALKLTDAGAPEQADLTERLATSVYRQGEAKRKAGDAAGAATDFLRVAQVAPASKVVVSSQYDAAAELINSKQWERAIQVLEAYRRDYPKTEYARDITRKLAVAYNETGHAGQAAAEFERIASTPGEEPAVAREALMQAADLSEKSDNAAHTAQLLEQFVKRYPTPVGEAVEAEARLAGLAEKSGNAERLAYWRNEIVKSDAGAGAARTDRTKYLAAEARLALATPSRDAFRAVAIKAPLKQSLVAKRKALDVALKNYQAVAAYEVAETTTAATYEMAELYRRLAKDLLASERPKKLSAEERDQYDSLLEEQAYPFEEQSISLHELNAKRAAQGVFDESVQKSFAALAELKPGRYGKTELSEQNFSDPAVLKAVNLRKAGKLDDALLELKTVTASNPADGQAWSELGLTLRQQGKFSEARAAYEQGVAAQPDYAPGWRNLAVLLDLYLGDPAAALPAMERYKQLSGEDKPVSGWIADLRQRSGIKAPAPAAPADGAAPGGAAPAGNDASSPPAGDGKPSPAPTPGGAG